MWKILENSLRVGHLKLGATLVFSATTALVSTAAIATEDPATSSIINSPLPNDPILANVGFTEKTQSAREVNLSPATILEQIEQYSNNQSLVPPSLSFPKFTAVYPENGSFALETDPDPTNQILKQIEQYNPANLLSQEDSLFLEPVNSVNQLTDVRPTDWAYSALQNLAERYSCLLAYPNNTFRGSRSLTRFEFAAGLNACLEIITEQINSGTENPITEDDLNAINKLQTDFAPELTQVRSQLDTLEARTAELDANQFSTTTKLKGSVSFLLRDSFAGENISNESNNTIINATAQPVIQYSANLDFLASFSGKDRLRVRLQSGNTQSLLGTRQPLVTDEGVYDQDDNELIVEEDEEELEEAFDEFVDSLIDEQDQILAQIDSLETQIETLIEQDGDQAQIDELQAQINSLEARYNEIDEQINELLNDIISAIEESDNEPSTNNSARNSGNSNSGNSDSNSGTSKKPTRSRSRNTISLRLLDYRFTLGHNLQVNLFASGGKHSFYADKITENRSNPLYTIGSSGAGIGLNYKFSDQFLFNLGYLATNGNKPIAENGLFDGSYSALGQLVIEPSDNFKLGLLYVRTYNSDGRVRFGGGGTYLNNLLRRQRVRDIRSATNSYALAASYRISPQFIVGGWLGFTNVDILERGDAEIWNYALTLSFPDLGQKGNLGIITVGVQPTLQALSIDDSEVDIPSEDSVFYIDASYKYQLTKGISITPAVVWQPALAQNWDNDDFFFLTLKTNFSF